MSEIVEFFIIKIHIKMFMASEISGPVFGY